MADWITLSNQAVGVGGLPSGTTVTALRDNPIAIAEGATGAPKVKNKALTGLFLGQISGFSGTWAGINDLDDIQGVFLSGKSASDTGASISIRFSTDNGSTWSSSYVLYDSASGFDFRQLYIDLVSGDYFGINQLFAPAALEVSGTATLPVGTVNAFQLLSPENSSWLSFATKGKST